MFIYYFVPKKDTDIVDWFINSKHFQNIVSQFQDNIANYIA